MYFLDEIVDVEPIINSVHDAEKVTEASGFNWIGFAILVAVVVIGAIAVTVCIKKNKKKKADAE